MPEHLRALGFILVLALVVFAFAKAPACATACAVKDFERRRNLWLAITLTAFLAHNFWIYLVVTAILLLAYQRSEQNRLAMYCFILFALPPITANLSGMGLFAELFQINYVRLLGLALLLPAYLSLRKSPETVPFGRSMPDKILACYLILDLVLMFEHKTFTNVLRHGLFYAFTDTFLPYYVASRSLRNLEAFRDALMSFAVAAMVLSAVLAFEFARYWLLYQSLERALGVIVVGTEYLLREGNLRASGTIGHSIVAGYVVAVAMGFYLYLRKVVPSSVVWGLGFLLLVAGQIGPMSRGPWVGAAAIVLIFVATGPAGVLGLARIGLVGLIAIPLLYATPIGQKAIDFLPFVGTVDASNVTFRQVLAQVSYEVFWENPLLGRYDFLATPAMEALRGNDGIIDLVNTYVVVALGSGIVGLSLFAGFFLVVISGVYNGMRKIADKSDECHVLGRALMATLLGILLIIATVSPIFVVPTIYWMSAGLGVAYARMLSHGKASPASERVAPRRSPGIRASVRGVRAIRTNLRFSVSRRQE